MPNSAFQPIRLTLSLALLAIVAGCGRHAASDNAPSKPTAEQRLDRILESFRRSVEDQPVSLVVSDGKGRSMMYGSYSVSSTLVPPKTEQDHYKAIIKVTTESQYSVRRTKSAEDAENEQKAKSKSTSPLSDAADAKGLAILDADLAGKSRDEKSQSPLRSNQSEEETTVSRRPLIEEREYELIDDGERWQLVSTLDPKTEQAIQFAFEQALDRQ